MRGGTVPLRSPFSDRANFQTARTAPPKTQKTPYEEKRSRSRSGSRRRDDESLRWPTAPALVSTGRILHSGTDRHPILARLDLLSRNVTPPRFRNPSARQLAFTSTIPGSNTNSPEPEWTSSDLGSCHHHGTPGAIPYCRALLVCFTRRHAGSTAPLRK